MPENEQIDYSFIEITTDHTSVYLAYIQDIPNPIRLDGDERRFIGNKNLLLRRCDYEPEENPFWLDSKINIFIDSNIRFGFIDRYIFEILPNSNFNYNNFGLRETNCKLGKLLYIVGNNE